MNNSSIFVWWIKRIKELELVKNAGMSGYETQRNSIWIELLCKARVVLVMKPRWSDTACPESWSQIIW